METTGEYRFKKLLRFGGAALLTAVMATGAAAAHDGQDGYGGYHDDHYGDSHGYDRGFPTDIRRIAMMNGYRAGFEHGAHDRRDRATFNYQHADAYRRGSDGYNGRWGSEREYQSAFRSGYAKGYADGYYGRSRSRSYGDYRTGGGYNNPYYGGGYGNGGYYDNREGDRDRDDVARAAAQNGYRAGFERGQYDAAQRNRANPQGHGAYQYGFDGFDPSWGSASTYQQYYRSYFVRGYQDGYNRRQYNNGGYGYRY